MSEEQFAAARDRLLNAASGNPKLASVRPSELPDVASLKVDINQPRLAALGLSDGDVNTTISAAWGGRYVNDFIDRGRVKRVYVQGDAPYRSEPSDIDQWFVRNNQGGMVPFSSFAQTSWKTTPTSLSRFLGYPSYELQGQGAPGVSSGEAMDIMPQHQRIGEPVRQMVKASERICQGVHAGDRGIGKSESCQMRTEQHRGARFEIAGLLNDGQ